MSCLLYAEIKLKQQIKTKQPNYNGSETMMHGTEARGGKLSSNCRIVASHGADNLTVRSQ